MSDRKLNSVGYAELNRLRRDYEVMYKLQQACEKAIEWISAKDKLPEYLPDSDDESIEVEISLWDGEVMSRLLGAYDYDMSSWHSYGKEIDTRIFTVTHWRIPSALPAPPTY